MSSCNVYILILLQVYNFQGSHFSRRLYPFNDSIAIQQNPSMWSVDTPEITEVSAIKVILLLCHMIIVVRMRVVSLTY